MVDEGTLFYGYCNGYFGSNYTDKVVEYVANDFIVVREIASGYLHILQGDIIYNIPKNWLSED